MTRESVLYLIGAGVVVLLLAATANAVTVLPADANAMGPWQGSVHVFGQLASFAVEADVDFAVYAPSPGASNFDATFGLGADPTGGTEYVYAYQVFNVTTGSISDTITEFQIGLDGDETLTGNPAASPPDQLGHVFFVDGTGDVSPSSALLSDPTGTPAPTAAVWSFLSVLIPSGQSSDVLLFTSPDGPEWDSATVGGDWTASGDVPSPGVPLPATLALLTAGSSMLLARRRRT